jgi:hypothetical protein
MAKGVPVTLADLILMPDPLKQAFYLKLENLWNNL